MKKILIFIVLFVVYNNSGFSQSYTFVAYNAENLFDLDEISVYDDYKTTDENGEPLYTPVHVLTKLTNVVLIMQQYNAGKGPDVIAFSEIESDFTPSHRHVDSKDFLAKWNDRTISDMITNNLTEEIMDIPAELLLLKAMEDNGLTGYDISVGYSELKNDKPTSAIKNVLFSKLPILKEKTKRHELEQARPILETWIDVKGNQLIIFVNHWKSGASSKDMEAIRVENAAVLKKRIDQLRNQNALVDFIIAGDFNTLYNQQFYIKGINTFAFRDVLLTTGNEQKVASAQTDSVYNLWYEIPYNKRGSEAYRGELSTLMNIIIPAGMYNYSGVSYVDQSFKVGAFPGLNTLSYAQVPIRWDSYGTGSGFSDHLPVSMEFMVKDNASGAIQFVAEFGKEQKEDAEHVKIEFELPKEGEFIKFSDINPFDMRKKEYYNQLFYCDLVVDENNEVKIGIVDYKVYAASRDIKKKLDDMRNKNGGKVRFYARNILYKSTWELYIDSENHILD